MFRVDLFLKPCRHLPALTRAYADVSDRHDSTVPPTAQDIDKAVIYTVGVVYASTYTGVIMLLMSMHTCRGRTGGRTSQIIRPTS